MAILVEPALAQPIRTSLDQFEADLCTDGYNTMEHTGGFADPPAVRAHLQQLHKQLGQNLAGAILIGNIPYAYQWVTLSGVYPTAEEAISFQYYADLDGTFEKSANYVSPGAHTYSFDIHSGNVNWEIWIGVLPSYKGNITATRDALTRYFLKNHSYRTGTLGYPNALLRISELHRASTLAEHDGFLRSMKNGWTPLSNTDNARLYFDSPPGGLSVAQGYAALQSGVADFTVQDAHGYWGASGQLTIQWAETSNVKTLFFWSNGCAVGNLDFADNFLTSVLYSRTSDVLLAKGTTNDSGGMGTNSNGFFGENVARSLFSGAGFGAAILSHVNVPLISPWSNSREFHFGTALLLGDPTLRRERTGYAGNPTPLATVSAASFTPEVPVAPEVIAAGYGTNLVPAIEIAPADGRLPMVLGGVSVKVRDSAGTERTAPLWFVSPAQINYYVPEGTALGLAAIRVVRDSQAIASGTLQIESVAPGLFAMNANGQGVPAALAVFGKADGTQTWQYVFNLGCQVGACQPVPIDLGPATDQVYLQLYGTGIRGRSSLSAVTAYIGGVAAPVEYAGPVAGMSGLDQVNLRVPRSLIGRGQVGIELEVDGMAANGVLIHIK